jgi:hypothetical protein
MCPPLRAHSQARPSGIPTDATIISETGGAKEEAGTVQRITAGFRYEAGGWAERIIS